ncbi:D-glycero-beta-D-manno-heptose 1-phosphate adenylyltransferase [Selenomonadales bacterium OttesenSCG-928-I06]|nr:D-glycero-beta-D-manno-heptose 1-phosphate adenylyltransferase [Selenomonadales bacterium OttesenSCG-928-I06]
MKIILRENLADLINKIRNSKKKIVFTNGCFDILHVGHTRYLKEAKSYGDLLIVGVNSDESVRVLKGETRPVNMVSDRVEVLAELESVDYVVVFDELTAEKMVSEVLPDVYIKGGDYVIEDLPEAVIVAENGGKTIIVPEVKGKSSSNIIQKINELR